MQPKFKILLLSILLILNICNCYAQKDRLQPTHTISIDFLYDCASGNNNCVFDTIYRNSVDEFILVQFPSDGYNTSVRLYSENEFSNLYTAKFAQPVSYLDYDYLINAKMLLTGLDDGKYFAQITGCCFGGTVVIYIVTR